MINIILGAVLLLISGAAAYYIYRAKKRGEHCVGCPYARKCAEAHGAAQGTAHRCGCK